MASICGYPYGYNSGREFAKAVGSSVSGEHRRVSSKSSSAVGDHL